MLTGSTMVADQQTFPTFKCLIVLDHIHDSIMIITIGYHLLLHETKSEARGQVLITFAKLM